MKLSLRPGLLKKQKSMKKPSSNRIFSIYMELAKSRLTGLVAFTAVGGFLLASRTHALDWALLFWTALGTTLASGGANGLNQCWEVFPDSLMKRTSHRPVPSRRISRSHAFGWSVSIALLGILILAVFVNTLTALLGALTVLLYILVYTPMKRRSSLCTLVGAVCGAIPPMMGWTGATNELGAGGWILAAILFIWQIPHFLALAWMYRDDYSLGGFRMLPVVDPNGALTCTAIILYSCALLPVGACLSLVGVTGWFYSVGSLLLGLMMLSPGLKFSRTRDDREARKLFFASLAYLSLLMGVIALDQFIPPLSSPAIATVVTGP